MRPSRAASASISARVAAGSSNRGSSPGVARRCARWRAARRRAAASMTSASTDLERRDLDAGHATHPPAAHHAPDAEAVVELDEVGALARRDAAAVGDPEHGQRIGACRGDGNRQGHAGRDEVAHGVVEGDDRPGQRRGPDERDPLSDDLDLETADPCPAVARPRERERVADEQQPVGRLQSSDQRPQRGIDVDPVGDELDEGRRRRAAPRPPGRARDGRRRTSR